MFGLFFYIILKRNQKSFPDILFAPFFQAQSRKLLDTVENNTKIEGTTFE